MHTDLPDLLIEYAPLGVALILAFIAEIRDNVMIRTFSGLGFLYATFAVPFQFEARLMLLGMAIYSLLRFFYDKQQTKKQLAKGQ